MRDWPSFFYWLTFAALGDWLLTRTFTRAFIHLPKSPPMILAYQGLILFGQMAATFSALLALVILGWIARYEWRARRVIWLPLILSGLAVLSLIFLVVVPAGWPALGNHLLILTAVALLMRRMHSAPPIHDRDAEGTGRFGRLVPALAILISVLYQLAPALYAALQWPGPPPFMGLLFNLGEFAVVLSPIALWQSYGYGASRRVWLVAALPTLMFSALYLADPATAGIMAVWSTGLTLYLPWPLYSLSLWLAGVTVAATLRRGHSVGLAILLLAAGGYAPGLSTHLFLSLIALWMLARPTAPATPAPRPGAARSLAAGATGAQRARCW